MKPNEDWIETTLARLTLAEKVSLLAGANFWETVAIDRLGIPSVKMTDGPNGARGSVTENGPTAAVFPAGIALGASWNPALVREVAQALAEEARSKGADVVLAPTVNMHRGPLNGRNFECFSEDPQLTTDLALAYIEGLQSKGVGATIKHFIGNESEYQRMTMSSDIGARALREIYLPPFEAAVRAGVWAVMCSYNRLNGTHTSEHKWLLTDLLKREYGFDGVVVSDWTAVKSTDPSVNAGLDLEMPGPALYRGQEADGGHRGGPDRPRHGRGWRAAHPAAGGAQRQAGRRAARAGTGDRPARTPRPDPPCGGRGHGSAEERRYPAADGGRQAQGSRPSAPMRPWPGSWAAAAPG